MILVGNGREKKMIATLVAAFFSSLETFDVRMSLENHPLCKLRFEVSSKPRKPWTQNPRNWTEALQGMGFVGLVFGGACGYVVYIALIFKCLDSWLSFRGVFRHTTSSLTPEMPTECRRTIFAFLAAFYSLAALAVLRCSFELPMFVWIPVSYFGAVTHILQGLMFASLDRYLTKLPLYAAKSK